MTMMNEITKYAPAVAAGAFIGALFFGGLWLTIKRALASPYAGLWFSASLFVRTVAALVGVYFLARGHAERLPACLAGFLVARLAATRLVGIPQKPILVTMEEEHAPHSR
jgi:F1F0 ATPase subunit 2